MSETARRVVGFAATTLKSATFWSAVAAVAAVCAVLLPLRETVLPEPQPARIIYKVETATDIAAPRPVNTRTRILFDGKEERDLRLFVFWIQYKGSKAILPEDFAEPIRASIPSDRKILIVQEAADDARGPNEYIRFRPSSYPGGQRIKGQSRRIDDTQFEFIPGLINPDDWFAVELYTAAATLPSSISKASPAATPEIEHRHETVTWKCHVKGVSCPPVSSTLVDYWPTQTSFWSFLPSASISLDTNESYAVCLLSAVNVILIMALAFALGLNRSTKVAQLWFLALAVLISVPSIGSIVSWVGDGDLPYHARVIVLIDIGLICLLAVNAISTIKTRSGGASNSGPEVPP